MTIGLVTVGIGLAISAARVVLDFASARKIVRKVSQFAIVSPGEAQNALSKTLFSAVESTAALQYFVELGELERVLLSLRDTHLSSAITLLREVATSQNPYRRQFVERALANLQTAHVLLASSYRDCSILQGFLNPRQLKAVANKDCLVCTLMGMLYAFLGQGELADLVLAEAQKAFDFEPQLVKVLQQSSLPVATYIANAIRSSPFALPPNVQKLRAKLFTLISGSTPAYLHLDQAQQA